MNATSIGIAVFGAAFCAVVALLLVANDRLARRNRRLRERMAMILDRERGEDKVAYTILRDDSFSRIPFLDRVLGRFRVTKQVQQKIEESGLPIKVGTLTLATLSLAGLVWLVFAFNLTSPVISIIPAACSGMIPYSWVLHKRRKRIERFEELLPEAIDLMVNALRSGFSLEASLSLVGQEIPDPVGSEFAISFEEQNIGLDFVQALENMNRRMPSNDLQIMTTAISIQKRTGGNLTEVLGKIAEMVRERMQLRREIKIFTAQGRFSGMVLALLPIALALILLFLNPEYLAILFTDPIGQVLLATAVGLQLLGFIAVKRIIRPRF